MQVVNRINKVFFLPVFIFFSYIASSQTSSIEGIVTDQNGRPIKNAEVFCEQGLFAPLLKVVTDNDGRFFLNNLRDEPTGIFATCNGFSWGGIHINIPPDEQIKDLVIVLYEANSIKGKVVAYDEKKKEIPVKGACVTRFALLGKDRVSIPLSKLEDFGYRRIISDAQGNFVLDKVPSNTPVSVKVEHPDFAIASNDGDMEGGYLKVILDRGCLVLGSVYLGEDTTRKKIPGAKVMIKNVLPPFETTCVTTDTRGEFAVRVKPGNYLCFAETDRYVTSGWLLKTVANPTGEYVNLPVYTSVNVYGIVRDAVTGEPVRGVRVYAEQGGQKLRIVNTGRSGKFRFKVAKGYLTIKFDSIPGYSLPTPSVINVAVSGAEDLELPGIWVKKLDAIKLAIKSNKNACGGYLSVINPYQFGWIRFEQSNLAVPIATLPSEGKLVGWILSPKDNSGNIFVLEPDSLGKTYEIELLKNSVITLDFVDAELNKFNTIAVECFFLDDNGKEYKLYKVFSQGEGKIFLKGMPSNVPLILKALNSEGKVIWSSEIIKLLPEETKDFGTIKLDLNSQSRGNESKIDFNNLNFQCGNKDYFKSKASLFVRLTRDEASYVLEPLKRIEEYLGGKLKVGLIVSEEINCGEVGIPVVKEGVSLRGSTVLVDEHGVIRFETEGLPIILSMYVEG